MGTDVVLTGTGLYAPESSIDNEELVKSFNTFVHSTNAKRSNNAQDKNEAILQPSSAAFIEKASGIKSRYVIEEKGILNPEIMHPQLQRRKEEALSYQAEFAVLAAKDAMLDANLSASDIDAVIVACSNYERPYPAIAIEVQNALGIKGFGFDMNVACSSATFAIVQANALIQSGSAQSVLVVCPEICSAHLNFKCRDSHFIFGDVATAMIFQSKTIAKASKQYKVLSSKLQTEYSNNIRNNSGFLERLYAADNSYADKEQLFHQNGRKVFKEVSLLVIAHMKEHMAQLGLKPQDLAQAWFHQANINMNQLIAEKLFGQVSDTGFAPNALAEFANTASCGSIIVMHQNKAILSKNDRALLCSFGAGYSIGSIFFQRVS